MNTQAVAQSLRPIDQNDMYAAIDLIEKTVEQNKNTTWSLCEAGKSYVALMAFYRSPLVQEHVINTGQFIDHEFFASQAMHYLTQAAEQQEGLAYHYLGHLYQNGIGVKQNMLTAFECYEKAVACGYLLSQHRLGYFYQNGIAVEKDIQQAIFYYEKVVTQCILPKEQRKTSAFGFCKAAQPIKRGISLKSTTQPIEYEKQLIGTLLSNLTKKVENGLIGALTNLGLLYLDGKDIEQNRLKAYEYLNEAAKLGCPNAQMSLGNVYQQGLGVKQDYFRAAEFYKQAAQQGHVLAQFSLGYLCQYGLGVTEDATLAKNYYESAALAGHGDALVRAGYCYYKGIGTEVDFDKAFFYYQKAADQHHPMGLENLGALYYQGLGVEEDRAMAKLLWDKAEKITNGS